MNRRKFLFNSMAVGTGIGLVNCNKGKTESTVSKTTKFTLPIVISTWDNRKANREAFKVLTTSASLLDAVVAGIKVPEADPEDQSVGLGGRPDRSGAVSLDACIMDQNGMAGSVTYVQNYVHVIELARAVMEKTPHVMLSGKGAEKFAAELGMKKTNLLTDKSRLEYEEWKKTSKYVPVINIEKHDTIGLLVLDKDGNLSGGCSTSGMAFKMEGRVGDSPIIGAGLYVDNEVGACTATGQGEYMLRNLSSFLVVELMKNGLTPQQACEEAIKRIVKKHKNTSEAYQIGLIALNKKGEIGLYGARKGFLCAVKTADNEVLIDSKWEINED